MKVRIYPEQKSAMQSGRARSRRVHLESDEIGARRPDSLMGWTSAPDTLNQVHMVFDSVDTAIRHAQKQNWPYTVALSHERKIKPRNYTDAFRYIPPEVADQA